MGASRGPIRDSANLYSMGSTVGKAGDVMLTTSLVRHDSARTARALVELCGELDSMNGKQGGFLVNEERTKSG